MAVCGKDSCKGGGGGRGRADGRQQEVPLNSTRTHSTHTHIQTLFVENLKIIIKNVKKNKRETREFDCGALSSNRSTPSPAHLHARTPTNPPLPRPQGSLYRQSLGQFSLVFYCCCVNWINLFSVFALRLFSVVSLSNDKQKNSYLSTVSLSPSLSLLVTLSLSLALTVSVAVSLFVFVSVSLFVSVCVKCKLN